MKHISPRPQPAAGNPKKPHPRAGEVRIIGGRFKRSKLTVPVASGLRPTGDRVRETLFNWLGQDLSGLRCFDAFAGSGALGFEAASRGAETVWIVERDRAALQALTQNQARLNVPGVRIVSGDAIALLSAQRSAGWDVVFLYPPFGDKTIESSENPLYQQALQAAHGAIAAEGLVYLESAQAWPESVLAQLGYQIHRAGKAGAVRFYLLAQVPKLD